MKSNFFKIFIFFILCFSTIAQDNHLKVPVIFSSKNQPQEITKFYQGHYDLSDEKYLKSNQSNKWIVYSDREKNELYRYPGGNVKMKGGSELKVDFFDSFYVKDVKYHEKKNYLLVENTVYKDISGWIPASKLVLSQHCLLSDFNYDSKNTLPVPRKAMILVSLNELSEKIGRGQIKDLDELLARKKFYKTPLPKKSSEGQSLGKFNIYFVFKHDVTTDTYLLGKVDYLKGVSDKKSSVLGWVESWAIQDWSTRICFEQYNNPSYHDIDFIKDRPGLLPGYANKEDLETGLETGIYPDYIDKNNPKNNRSYLISFRAEPMSNNRMRMPILEAVDYWEKGEDKRQIYNVVSIAKDNSNMDKRSQRKIQERLDQITKLHKDVNIIFAIDATGSMSPYASAVAESLSEIGELNKTAKNANLQFGFIFFRDYKDGGPENGQKLSFSSNNRKKVALEYLPLQRVKGTATDKFQAIINNTPFGSVPDKNVATNEPEAVYNGLINGLKQIFESGGKKDLYKNQSNVLVLIGDCGNYDTKHDKNGYKLSDVEKVFNEYKINLITFQVDNQNTRSHAKFNFDGSDLGERVGKSWIKGKESLKLVTKFNPDPNNMDTRKLEIYSTKSSITTNSQSDNFTPVFSTFTFRDEKAFSPDELKDLIKISFQNYMDDLTSNINALAAALTSGVEGQEPAPLLIAQIMEMFKISEQEAKEFLMRQEITVEAKIVENYSFNEKALSRVAFLTENEMKFLVRQLGKKMSRSDDKGVKKLENFQNGLKSMVETIIGGSNRTENSSIGNSYVDELTMDDAWRIIFGAPFASNEFKILKDVELGDLSTLKKQRLKKLKEFIEYFYDKTDVFLNKQSQYSSGSILTKRKFEIFGVDGSFFWVPLSDLPGTTN